eukprot:snap_masked-scaffold_2-processed-gene-6.3-mRNA-1 protein AED:1.00 eAED:1.00 QI:0/0/0/0/1/1/2/0/98
MFMRFETLIHTLTSKFRNSKSYLKLSLITITPVFDLGNEEERIEEQVSKHIVHLLPAARPSSRKKGFVYENLSEKRAPNSLLTFLKDVNLKQNEIFLI